MLSAAASVAAEGIRRRAGRGRFFYRRTWCQRATPLRVELSRAPAAERGVGTCLVAKRGAWDPGGRGQSGERLRGGMGDARLGGRLGDAPLAP